MPIHTPNLRSVPSAPEAVTRDLAVPRERVELFLVTAEGSYGGWWFGAGDLIVCRGEARPGDVTVLVARGQGRPRLGKVDGSKFRGDAGELCLPARWRAAGRVVARYRRGAEGWVAQLIERGAWEFGAVAVGGPSVPAGAAAEGRGERPSAAHQQLSLFAAA